MNNKGKMFPSTIKVSKLLTHHNRSSIHNKNPVTVNDCVKTMGNGQHCAINKSATNCCLNQFISSAAISIIIQQKVNNSNNNNHHHPCNNECCLI